MSNKIGTGSCTTDATSTLRKFFLSVLLIFSLFPTLAFSQSSVPTSTILSLSFNPLPLGRPLAISVTVSGNNPTGSVCFYFDGSSQSTGCGIPITNGKVTFSIGAGGSMTSVGNHSVNVIYSGDSANLTSSGSLAYSVIATNLSADKTSIGVGETVTFTASVPGNNPTGTVSFKSGSSFLNDVSLVGGSAKFSTSFGRVGTYAITAVYNGDTNNPSMSSPTLNLSVTTASTASTTAVTLSSTSLSVGDPLNLNIVVSGSNPTGSVCLYFDGSSQAAACGISLVSGQVNYTYNLAPASNGSVGNHSLRVEYSGDTNNRGSSATATYSIAANNAAPTVSLTAPSNNATYDLPANITLAASASDSDGTVTKVEFFNGTTLLATLSQAPYTFAWKNVPTGTYAITAKATDDQGKSSTSTIANIRVNGTAQTAYYIYTDQLNTPRAVTNQNGSVVWQWDNTDPFGANVPNQDPGNTGKTFEVNFRFPGQYYDKETNLHYNLNRDYDPQVGRYIQPDPIGLQGGLNTYAYVNNGPLRYSDPKGLCPWCIAGYVFLAENSATIGTAAAITAEIISGVPNPVSTPASFAGRAAQELTHDVYLGIKNGQPVYAGITKDLMCRSSQHGDRFDELARITNSPVTKDQARAIEQALINNNPQFQNQINSISPSRSWYDQAVQWGQQWLSNSNQ